jgi:hypothetical protein
LEGKTISANTTKTHMITTESSATYWAMQWEFANSEKSKASFGLYNPLTWIWGGDDKIWIDSDSAEKNYNKMMYEKDSE